MLSSGKCDELVGDCVGVDDGDKDSIIFVDIDNDISVDDDDDEECVIFVVDEDLIIDGDIDDDREIFKTKYSTYLV